jgi:hypothetical protein
MTLWWHGVCALMHTCTMHYALAIYWLCVLVHCALCLCIVHIGSWLRGALMHGGQNSRHTCMYMNS